MKKRLRPVFPMVQSVARPSFSFFFSHFWGSIPPRAFQFPFRAASWRDKARMRVGIFLLFFLRVLVFGVTGIKKV